MNFPLSLLVKHLNLRPGSTGLVEQEGRRVHWLRIHLGKRVL